MNDDTVEVVELKNVVIGDVLRINGQRITVLDVGPLEVCGGNHTERKMSLRMDTTIGANNQIQRWSMDQPDLEYLSHNTTEEPA